MTRRADVLIMVLLLIGAFLPRVTVLTGWNETPGDGPTRALLAHIWAQKPSIVLHDGGWPPGHMYLAGTFSYVFGDSLFSSRVLSLVLGTLTVPVCYLLWARLFDRAVAASAAVFLVFLPLHIGLSASSLSDVAFLFEFLAGLLLFIVAAATARRWRYLLPSLFLLSLATMTRYEAWLVIPFVTAYYFGRTRDARGTVIVSAALLAFPVSWLMGNRISTGDFFHGFVTAAAGTRGTVEVSSLDLINGIKAAGRKAVTHIGWIPLFLAASGVVMQLFKFLRRRLSIELTLYLAVLGTFGALFLAIAVIRGAPRLWDRYALADLVMLLPFIFVATLALVRSRGTPFRLAAGLTVLAVIASLGAVNVDMVRSSRSSVHTPVYVTQRRPAEIERLAAWFRASPYRQEAVLLTVMNWEATYLPLYLPEVAVHHLVVSSWTTEPELREFLASERPATLVTRDADARYWPLIEGMAGRIIQSREPVYEVGSTKVYLIPYETGRGRPSKEEASEGCGC